MISAEGTLMSYLGVMGVMVGVMASKRNSLSISRARGIQKVRMLVPKRDFRF